MNSAIKNIWNTASESFLSPRCKSSTTQVKSRWFWYQLTQIWYQQTWYRSLMHPKTTTTIHRKAQAVTAQAPLQPTRTLLMTASAIKTNPSSWKWGVICLFWPQTHRFNNSKTSNYLATSWITPLRNLMSSFTKDCLHHSCNQLPTLLDSRLWRYLKQ